MDRIERIRHRMDTFRVEECIPKNLINVYLSFVSIISVVKEINLRDIELDIESVDMENLKFSSWFSWNWLNRFRWDVEAEEETSAFFCLSSWVYKEPKVHRVYCALLFCLKWIFLFYQKIILHITLTNKFLPEHWS